MKCQRYASWGVAAVVIGVALVPVVGRAQRPQGQGAAPAPVAARPASAASKTPWGEPDLQGIWGDEYQAPLQRPAKYANKEFFSAEEMAALDRERAAILRRDYRGDKGSETDVAGAYNAFWMSVRKTGRRTSLIVDPPNGRYPAFTAEFQKKNQAEREFIAALLQNTKACKDSPSACGGGKYGPPSPRRNEVPPFYNTGRMPNRVDGTEDRSIMERCLANQHAAGTGLLPDFSNDMSWGVRRIVQSPGVVSIYYDVGQGQGWQRVIPITNQPHLPSGIRLWAGDARGRWEGNTLVVDTTNFTAKTVVNGSRENLHIIERFTRVDAKGLAYEIKLEDPTVWVSSWTARQEMTLQNNEANRIYSEPRCHEGNYGLTGMLVSQRAIDLAFAEGRGPDPATMGGQPGGAGGEENRDDLQ